MKNLDLQVIQQATMWLEQDRCVWLCTVLATFGSAPRGPGSLLAALSMGELCGSLSGCCVEEDFLERSGRHEFVEHNHVVRYGEGGLAPSLELPCGDVLVARFEPDCAAKAHFAILLAALQGRQRVVRHVTLGTSVRHTQIHDPRMDDLTLLEAVRTSAFYIGAMGSRRTSEKRHERVMRIGALSPQILERIHAPIGLNLGSKTQAEIALAVMADIVRMSNGVVRDQL